MIDRSLPHPGYPDPDGDRRRRAKTLARILVGSCADCGASGLAYDLVPVGDDHLTFFAGDELCHSCAVAHGVL